MLLLILLISQHPAIVSKRTGRFNHYLGCGALHLSDSVYFHSRSQSAFTYRLLQADAQFVQDQWALSPFCGLRFLRIQTLNPKP